MPRRCSPFLIAVRTIIRLGEANLPLRWMCLFTHRRLSYGRLRRSLRSSRAWAVPNAPVPDLRPPSVAPHATRRQQADVISGSSRLWTTALPLTKSLQSWPADGRCRARWRRALRHRPEHRRSCLARGHPPPRRSGHQELRSRRTRPHRSLRSVSEQVPRPLPPASTIEPAQPPTPHPAEL